MEKACDTGWACVGEEQQAFVAPATGEKLEAHTAVDVRNAALGVRHELEGSGGPREGMLRSDSGCMGVLPRETGASRSQAARTEEGVGHGEAGSEEECHIAAVAWALW